MGRLSFDSLDARIPKSASVTTAQRYCRNLLLSRTVAFQDKQLVVDYVKNNRRRFTPIPYPNSPTEYIAVSKINGPDPQWDFVGWAIRYLKNMC